MAKKELSETTMNSNESTRNSFRFFSFSFVFFVLFGFGFAFFFRPALAIQIQTCNSQTLRRRRDMA